MFAGSGALGLEAYSRGAKDVTLVELDKDNNINDIINIKYEKTIAKYSWNLL